MKLRYTPLFAVRLLTTMIIGVLLASSAARPSYSQANQTKFRFNGTSAWAFACNLTGPEGFPVCSYISVGRDDQQNSTFLGFLFYAPTADGDIIVGQGEGIIPNEDLVGDGPGMAARSLRLSTYVQPNKTGQGFTWITSRKCSPDFRNCTYTPLEGYVTANFDKTDAFTFDGHEFSHSTFKQFDGSLVNFHRNGQFTSSSARITATFFGLPVDFGNEGSLGSARSQEITIERSAP